MYFVGLFALLFSPLALALPTVSGCGTSFEWTAHDLTFNSSSIWITPAHSNNWGRVSFTLTNTLLTYAHPCSASSARVWDYFSGDQWYKCDDPPLTSPVVGAEAYFRYNLQTGKLDVNQTWTCLPKNGYIRSWASGTSGTNTSTPLVCASQSQVTPNWTNPSQFYKVNITDCDPIDLLVTPTEMTQIA